MIENLLSVKKRANRRPSANRATDKKAVGKLSDGDRYDRFVKMAQEVAASENPVDFESAFDKIVMLPRDHSK